MVHEPVECSPCFLRECLIDFRCMQRITEEQVAEAVLQLCRGRAADGTVALGAARRLRVGWHFRS